MNKIKGICGMLALAEMFNNLTGDIPKRRTRLSDIDFSSKEKPIPNGCKKYKFGDFETIASSEKRAIDKYNKWLNKRVEENGIVR